MSDIFGPGPFIYQWLQWKWCLFWGFPWRNGIWVAIFTSIIIKSVKENPSKRNPLSRSDIYIEDYPRRNGIWGLKSIIKCMESNPSSENDAFIEDFHWDITYGTPFYNNRPFYQKENPWNGILKMESHMEFLKWNWYPYWGLFMEKWHMDYMKWRLILT